MKTDQSREIIRDFAKSSLAKKSEHLEIKDHDNIIANGMIDSLGIIKTINFLEEKFHIVIKDEDVVPENFESIEALTTFVDRMSGR